MKEFRIAFYFETDDDWTETDVEEMVTKLIDPIYHLGDVDVGELIVDLIGED